MNLIDKAMKQQGVVVRRSPQLRGRLFGLAAAGQSIWSSAIPSQPTANLQVFAAVSAVVLLTGLWLCLRYRQVIADYAGPHDEEDSREEGR